MNVLLSQEGIDINASTDSGFTALLASCSRGYSDIADVLIKHGADTEATDEDNVTSLMVASIHGFKDVVFLLLDAGCEVDTVNSKGWSALLLAVEGGFYQIVCRLIKSGADVNIRTKDILWTPLMSASANGYFDIAEDLVREGADVNAQQAGGWSSLMIAVRAGHTEIVKLLLINKSLIDNGDVLWNFKRNINENSSVREDRERKVQLENATPLLGAISGGHSEIINILLEYGADPNITTAKGVSALMIAVKKGCKDDINTMLRYHAKVTIYSDFGYTALLLSWLQIRGIVMPYRNMQSVQVLELKDTSNIISDSKKKERRTNDKED